MGICLVLPLLPDCNLPSDDVRGSSTIATAVFKLGVKTPKNMLDDMLCVLPILTRLSNSKRENNYPPLHSLIAQPMSFLCNNHATTLTCILYSWEGHGMESLLVPLHQGWKSFVGHCLQFMLGVF